LESGLIYFLVTPKSTPLHDSARFKSLCVEIHSVISSIRMYRQHGANVPHPRIFDSLAIWRVKLNLNFGVGLLAANVANCSAHNILSINCIL